MIINNIASIVNTLIQNCYSQNISFTQILVGLIIVNVCCYIIKKIISVIGEVKTL